MPVLFCGIVFLFAYEKGLISKILKLPSLLHLGKLSYSIYMVHTAIITALTALLILAGKVAGKKFALHIGWERYFSFDNVLLNNLFFCFVVTLVLFVSNLTYKYIEVPGIALGRKKLRIAKTEAAATE